MKQAYLILSIIISTCSFGQTLKQQLKQIHTVNQAEEFIKMFPGLKGRIINVDSNADTLNFHKQIFRKRNGDIFSIKRNTYKVFYDTTTILLRVNYIYLDGSRLSKENIDSLRTYILAEYKRGVSFDSLAVNYTMDGNTDFGDTNWFSPEVMVKEFSEAVQKHHTSEVFIVDVPEKSWYYVVRKTYEPKLTRQMKIISVTKGG